jgi:hypothetical protein
MEKQNEIQAGKSPADLRGKRCVRVSGKRALSEDETDGDVVTLSSFTEPLTPASPEEESETTNGS